MQESLTLSNPPPTPEAAVAPQAAELPLQQMQEKIQALRTVVQSQNAQLQLLQEQAQAEPLVGFTTDSNLGMALEGLVLGLVALGLGVAAFWGSRAPQYAPAVKGSIPASRKPAPAEFADSMLYLADQEEMQDAAAAVSAQLHDPQDDAHGATLAHEDGDPELEYHRMALTKQGLSVTAGAGRVDSDRVPLDEGGNGPSAERSDQSQSAFSPSLPQAEFDRRAANEEVERVRRYLAQRRADRAKAQLGNAPEGLPPAPVQMQPAPVPRLDVDFDLGLAGAATPEKPFVPAPAASVEWEDLVQSAAPAAAAPPSALVSQLPVPAALPEEGIDMLEHAELSEGASLLAAFSDSELAPYADPPPQHPVPEAAAAPAPSIDESPEPLNSLLEWELSPAAADAPVVEAHPETGLPRADVQMQLALEFRDLGLWEEARERAMEILEQPDTGLHAQARTLIEELAQTAPVSLAEPAPPPPKDPWG